MLGLLYCMVSEIVKEGMDASSNWMQQGHTYARSEAGPLT